MPLLAEAAEILGPVRNDVVVIGAAPLEVALADAPSVAITPTRDVDLVVSVDRAADAVSISRRRTYGAATSRTSGASHGSEAI